jgi:hypothetical protein
MAGELLGCSLAGFELEATVTYDSADDICMSAFESSR